MTPQIRIVDSAFSHCHPGSYGTGDLKIPPTCFNWHRGEQIGDVVVFTDDNIVNVESYSEKIKIAMLIEPFEINRNTYAWAVKNHDKFTYILTYNDYLLSLIPNGVYFVFCGSWIWPSDHAIHEKTKSVSIIASDKRTTSGHILRHSAINAFRGQIEGIYGRGYEFIENKIEALKDYRYSIVIENDKKGGIISEKLIDCFVTGTIPIYYGHDKAKDFFNPDGMLFFDDLAQLGECLQKATPGFYESRREAIEDNFERAKEFCLPEDRIWKMFFEPKIFNNKNS